MGTLLVAIALAVEGWLLIGLAAYGLLVLEWIGIWMALILMAASAMNAVGVLLSYWSKGPLLGIGVVSFTILVLQFAMWFLYGGWAYFS
jgi:hypothetical protein